MWTALENSRTTPPLRSLFSMFRHVILNGVNFKQLFINPPKSGLPRTMLNERCVFISLKRFFRSKKLKKWQDADMNLMAWKCQLSISHQIWSNTHYSNNQIASLTPLSNFMLRGNVLLQCVLTEIRTYTRNAFFLSFSLFGYHCTALSFFDSAKITIFFQLLHGISKALKVNM